MKEVMGLPRSGLVDSQTLGFMAQRGRKLEAFSHCVDRTHFLESGRAGFKSRSYQGLSETC